MTQIVHSSRRATRKKRTACEILFIVIIRGRGVLADMSDPFIAMLLLLLFCETIRYIALFPIYDISHNGLQRRGMLELTFRELKNGLRARCDRTTASPISYCKTPTNAATRLLTSVSQVGEKEESQC